MLAVFFKDVEHALPIALTSLFYISPVFYPISLVPDLIRPFYVLNPIAQLLDLFHRSVYYGQFPELSSLLLAAVSVSLIFCLGYFSFAYYKKWFAEIL